MHSTDLPVCVGTGFCFGCFFGGCFLGVFFGCGFGFFSGFGVC